MELPFGKISFQNIPKMVLFLTLVLILFTIIPLCYPLLTPLFRWNSFTSSSSSSSDHDLKVGSSKARSDETCDIFTGEWVRNPEAPYYTNVTCWAIHDHQNCMRYGRPDTDFMKWRWKPDGCELPLFNPYQFLMLMRGKSLAFVGDSVARNQMQSLICLLSRVEYPADASYASDEYFKRWKYTRYNFTIATFWSSFLVKSMNTDPNGPTQTGLFSLYLYEFDEKWTSQIDEFDYVIISAKRCWVPFLSDEEHDGPNDVLQLLEGLPDGVPSHLHQFKLQGIQGGSSEGKEERPQFHAA